MQNSILSKISAVLANNQIGIFAVSTYNTDYILVKKENFDKALTVLSAAGSSDEKPAEEPQARAKDKPYNPQEQNKHYNRHQSEHPFLPFRLLHAGIKKDFYHKGIYAAVIKVSLSQDTVTSTVSAKVSS